MRTSLYILCAFIMVSATAFGQDNEDTLIVKELDQVVVTATRTQNTLGNVAVPMQLISRRTIVNSGAVRLQDILAEQTGLYITSGGATSSAGGGVFGNGLQIQGMSPDYTLILIDGEPVIGRQGGVIDLSRLAVGNIKRIEVVKGPSSSLYGSEAMGGVVNIISEHPDRGRFDAAIRLGRFGTTDANINAAMRNKKWGLQVFGNRNASQGFDLDDLQPGKTVDPYTSYTAQLIGQFDPSEKSRLKLSVRYYYENQSSYFVTSDLATGAPLPISGNGIVRDISVNPAYTHQFSNRFRNSIRFYLNRYEYEQHLLKETDKSEYYRDFFRQDFVRLEDQADFSIGQTHQLSAGAGIARELLNTTRYAGKRHTDNQYLFLQDEWRLAKLTVIGGLRFDNNSAYRSRLSPKLAVRLKAGSRLTITGSYGSGFKAPDFRQLFLSFLNTAAGGYVVYGANEITLEEILRQQQEGIITEILPRAYSLSKLNPEISRGVNLGARWKVSEDISADLNLFRNGIDDLILVDVIAYRNNGAPVYSYFNVKKAFTQGVELNGVWNLSEFISISAGYQFLMTADKEDLRRLKEGTVFTRDEISNESTRVSRGEYGGLPNRSAHMANIKLAYEGTKWSGSFRTIYKSRWGTTDKDGNALINRHDEYAPGYVMMNVAVSRILGPVRLQSGINNLLNYTDRLHLPGQPGIQPYFSVSYSFINKKNKN